jgi:hypothetical protein
MLDVFSHFAALDVLRGRLGMEVAAGALTDARAVNAYKSLQAQYPYAIFGSVIDHLLTHDGPSDTEVGLLKQCMTIWTTMRSFQLDYRSTRAKIEQVAINPTAPTALADYNTARQAMSDLIGRYDQIIGTLQAFRWQLHPLGHLTRHPQADDQSVKSWPWRDVVLSRRTGAFAAEVMKLARDIGSQASLAFGVGVLSSYAANAIGSPYLVHAVGGSRRSHPYRDRLASYAVGAWLQHVPLPIELDFDRTLSVPVFGSPNAPALPPWLRDMILKALDATYAKHGPPAPPDLDAAYGQLIQHWRLLQGFAPLPPAAPIATHLRVEMNTRLSPSDYDRPDPGASGPSSGGPAPSGSGGNIFDPGPGQPPWFRPAHNDWTDWVAEICEDILLAPLLIVRVGFYLGHKSGDQKPTTTGAARAALSTPLTPAEFATTGGKDILIAVDELFYLDAAVQRLAVDCLRLLKYLGLLYAEAKELHNPEFLECLVLPPASLGLAYPARPLRNPDLFLDLPASPLEKPAKAPSRFAAGEKPITFLFRSSSGSAVVVDDGFDMLKQELLELPTSPVRVTNLNLDADRGIDQACWTLKSGTSINDDPIKPVVLDYGAV